VVSYQVYAALRHNNPRAKLSYAEYCLLSTQVRYFDWDHVKKQMYKVHLPHLRSGYVARIEYEAATDAEGRPDWTMYYTPGPNAAAEYRAFTGGGNRAVQRLSESPARPTTLALPFSDAAASAAEPTEPTHAADPGPEAPLAEELVAQGVGRAAAQKLAADKPDVCRLHLDEYIPYLDALAARGEFAYRNGRGAYLHDAIRREYGPPMGFEAVRQREREKRVRSEQAVRQQARISHAEALRADYEAYLAGMLMRMPKSQPEAFAAFMAQDGAERKKLQAIGLSLKKFESPGQHLVRFRQFFTGKGVLEFWEWDRQLNPKPLEAGQVGVGQTGQTVSDKTP